MKEIYYHLELEYSIGVTFEKNVKADFRFVAEDYPAELSDEFDEQEFLEALASARNSKNTRIYGKNKHLLDISNSALDFKSSDNRIGGMHLINKDFDHFFLDSLSVIENGERKKRECRDINIGAVEMGLLSVLRKDPYLLNTVDPRSYEYAIAVLLIDLGFSKVNLTRFSKDNGIDIYASYSDSNKDFLVVVEVKKHGDNVGIEIVDRIYGAMHRNNADKALIVTSSSITSTVKKLYNAHSHHMSCLDYDLITEFLGNAPGSWVQSPSGLWTSKNSLINR
ncbi:restriction endonuclease [Aeromonas veronii]